MPGSVPIVAMNKRDDNTHVMTSDTDEDMMKEDDGPDLADEAPQDVTNIDSFGLSDTEPIVMDDLGSHEVVRVAAEESSDAAEDQVDKDIMEDNTGLPLGEWVNLPR